MLWAGERGFAERCVVVQNRTTLDLKELFAASEASGLPVARALASSTTSGILSEK